MTDIAAAIREPLSLECADGQVRKLAYIGGTALAEFSVWINRQKGENIRSLVSMIEIGMWAESVHGMRWLIWRSMKDKRAGNNPVPPEEEVGELIAFKAWPDLVATLLDFPEPDEQDEADDGSDP